MKSYYDLSRIIHDDEPVYPGDPMFQLKEIKTMAQDGFSDFSINCSMHVGTHIDAPGHILNKGKLISDYPISKFIGNAICFDVRGIQKIGLEHIQSESVKTSDNVLLFTDFDRYYGEDKYYSEHPVITKELALWFVQMNINIIGMDFPSPDYSPYAIHEILLKNDILLIENLKGLSALPQNVDIDFWALPMPIKSSAASIRVVVYF